MQDGPTAFNGKPLLDDDDLQDLIVERLDGDPVFHLGSGRRARFEVEVDDGEVTLRGVVRTPLDRRKADIIARALGATTVDNRLGVEEATATPPAHGAGDPTAAASSARCPEVNRRATAGLVELDGGAKI